LYKTSIGILDGIVDDNTTVKRREQLKNSSRHHLFDIYLLVKNNTYVLSFKQNKSQSCGWTLANSVRSTVPSVLWWC